MWLAWNEPNSSVFLQPQFERVGGTWRMAAPAAYAQICNAHSRCSQAYATTGSDLPVGSGAHSPAAFPSRRCCSYVTTLT